MPPYTSTSVLTKQLLGIVLNQQIVMEDSVQGRSSFMGQDVPSVIDTSLYIRGNTVHYFKYITSLIVDASRAYNVDLRLVANLIKSESNFRPNIKHSLPQVQCMSGINLKAHPKVLYNPDTITGCVFALAEVLSKYIEDSDGLTLALTKYKGFSPLGHTQAKQVIKDTYK